MGLRMRNYNSFEILWKLWFLRGRGEGGGHKNKNIEEALPKNGGLGEFANLRVGLGKKEGCSVFEGGGGGWYSNEQYGTLSSCKSN